MRQALTQIVDQPAAGAAGGAAALVDDVDGEADEAAVVFLEVEALQAAGGDVLLDHVQGHVAPAEAGQEVIEPAAEIDEAPDPRADADKYRRRGVRGAKIGA